MLNATGVILCHILNQMIMTTKISYVIAFITGRRDYVPVTDKPAKKAL